MKSQGSARSRRLNSSQQDIKTGVKQGSIDHLPPLIDSDHGDRKNHSMHYEQSVGLDQSIVAAPQDNQENNENIADGARYNPELIERLRQEKYRDFDIIRETCDLH